MRTPLVVAVLSVCLAFAQTPELKSIHKIYIDKLPNDLDQYLRAEFFKQMKGKISVVLEEKDADGILTGISEEEKGTGAKVTGRNGSRGLQYRPMSTIAKIPVVVKITVAHHAIGAHGQVHVATYRFYTAYAFYPNVSAIHKTEIRFISCN